MKSTSFVVKNVDNLTINFSWHVNYGSNSFQVGDSESAQEFKIFSVEKTWRKSFLSPWVWEKNKVF